MFAVDHAATALLIKRRFPSVSLTPMLVSVQAMELAWVGFNYLGIERTTTAQTVRSVADINLAYMPYSHSIATAVGAALLAWLIIEKGFGRASFGRAVGLGIVSHLILDLATHGLDIVLWPGLAAPKLGLGLYAAAPMLAFFVELIYGTFCWYVYRGGPGLLVFITIGNLANLSILSPDIPGPEQYLAGRPLLLVTFIFVQIVVSLVLVGILARRHREASTGRWPADHRLLPGIDREDHPRVSHRTYVSKASRGARHHMAYVDVGRHRICAETSFPRAGASYGLAIGINVRKF